VLNASAARGVEKVHVKAGPIKDFASPSGAIQEG
jgi:hypothetical protein